MANITKRTNKHGEVSYLIRVFIEQGVDGKQTTKSKTWKPPNGMKPAAAEKRAEKEAILFEERVRSGIVTIDARIKFEDYAALWMEPAQIAPATRSVYNELLKRINAAIGHRPLEKLQAHHLELFYKGLKEDGVKDKGSYAVSVKIKDILKERKLTVSALANKAGVAPATVRAARDGKHLSIIKARQIAEALGVDYNDVFQIWDNTTGLSDKTVLHHHRLISAILEKAKRARIIPYNVAREHATSPKVQRKEAISINEDQARLIVTLLLAEEDVRIKTSVLLLLYSGIRRGELCGLEWRDIDNSRCMIHINRASQYQRGKGIVEVPTKNISSERPIKLPDIVFRVLDEYRSWWDKNKQSLGDSWNGTCDRLFIQSDGKPINPDTINFWFDQFLDKHSLPHFTPHTCRHTFISLQLAAGVDIRTLQARTGHAQASTLVNMYAHVIKSAAEAASDIVDDVLSPQKAD